MLIGGIVAAVMVVALTVALVTRRMSQDDVHSVEGYHRSIHTLETMNAHPSVAESSLSTKAGHPARAPLVLRSTSVRVTDAAPPDVPPVAPPVTDPDVPLTFDDDAPLLAPAPSQSFGRGDKAMGTMNHRPRRLAAPATAVAVVVVLVVVLLVTGSHMVTPPAHHKTGSSTKNSNSPASHPGRVTTATTTSTTSPQVVVPEADTAHSAMYTVSGPTFTLAFSATSGACWVNATNATTGATLFSGTLPPGAQHSLEASGPVTVDVGAPTVLAVLVNGSPVALPSGFLTPFTMKFVLAPS